MALTWRKMKHEEDSRRLRCSDCDNAQLFAIVQPVKRQAKSKAKSMAAHHRRIIARFPNCDEETRITFGGPK